MTTRRLPPIESLDYILKEVDDIERNEFLRTMDFIDTKNKAVSYHTHKKFKANEEKLLVNEEGKSYFEVELSKDGDIISHIDLGSSTATSSLKVGPYLFHSGRRVVNCASIYTPINLIITLESDHDMENTIFLSWKTTFLMDEDLRNRVMYANLECDGLRYLNGMVMI